MRYSALLLALLCATATSGVVSTVAAQANADWEVPRTLNGHPDLQGNWSNSTLTPFERSPNRGPVYTWEEVAEIEEPDGNCPANPGTVACGRTQRTTGTAEARLSGVEYNEVYWERGQKVAVINGEPRTSLITFPADGRRPALTAEAERQMQERRDVRSQFAQYDHPEMRPLAERCIMFGAPLGPPMTPTGAYNSNYTIVQTADYVVIMSEMVHDVRIINLGEPSRMPASVRPWFGDSWGRWEGDVLVVETTNLGPQQTIRGVPPSEDIHVTERFSLSDQNTILYEFTVDDPTMYTEPWGGQMPINRFDARLYEYACHEGNYSLQGVLSGARYQERMAAEEASGAGR